MAERETSRQALFAVLAGLVPLVCAPAASAFDFSDPAARAQIAPGASGQAVSPGQANAGLSKVQPTGDSSVRQSRLSSSVSPRLLSILRTLSLPGWTDLGSTIYKFENGRLKVLNQIAGHKDTDAASSAGDAGQPPSLSYNDSPILNEFGCRYLIQKVMQRGNRFITTYMYEFADTDGANAGYDLMRRGSTTVRKRGDGSSEDGENISFWQDRYLFIISGTSEGDDESKEVITRFADMIAGAIPEHAQPPAVLASLPVIDRVKGSEKVVMGPLSASKYFSAPELHALALEKARAAALADYQVFEPARERMKLLFVDYGTNEAARNAYQTFVARLQELHEAEMNAEGPDARSLFRINKSYLLCQLKPNGKLVLITGARKSKSPALLASQIIER